jgi:transcriptional regulator with XRE-family HTH domain
MSIGTTIKALRTAKKLTQEELASYLGITSKAVSQWECDRTSPDISQIPALCNFFQISADQLLDINLAKAAEEKQKLLNKYYELWQKGFLCEGWTLLQEGITIFPNDYSIMMHLSFCGNRYCKASELTNEEKDSIKKQCVAYCKRILDGCTDDFIRNAAISNLCTYYAEKGETNKAKKLALKMPLINMSQEFLLAKIYKGTKSKKANQTLNQVLLGIFLQRFGTNYTLDSGENLYSPKESAALTEKKISLLELLFENGDYGYYSRGLSEFHEESARYHASVGNTEIALEHLEKAARLAIDFISNMQKGTFTHTSLFFKELIAESNSVCFINDSNPARFILKNMGQQDYDIVRETEKFKYISDMLRPFAEIDL